jgi:hypothetical protein
MEQIDADAGSVQEPPVGAVNGGGCGGGGSGLWRLALASGVRIAVTKVNSRTG